MANEVKRSARVAEGLREEISRLVAQRVRDPRVAGVVVSRVELSDDLRNAKVYVRVLDQEKRDEALAGLASAAGMLRSAASKALKLRHAPELRFFYDEGQDKLARIEELLEEIKRS